MHACMHVCMCMLVCKCICMYIRMRVATPSQSRSAANYLIGLFCHINRSLLTHTHTGAVLGSELLSCHNTIAIEVCGLCELRKARRLLVEYLRYL